MPDRIGIDLGGTKIEGVVLSHEGEIRERIRVPTPGHDYDGTITAIADLAERLDPAHRLKIGVALSKIFELKLIWVLEFYYF